jgi:hypothetical protein
MEYNNSEQSNRKEQVMSPLTLELPTPLISKIAELKIPIERIHSFVVQALEVWVSREAKSRPKEESEASTRTEKTQQTAEVHSLFSESAVPFIEQFITENQALFEELAKL